MPFHRVNGIQIYFEEHGKEEPLLLIQGLGYPSGMWFLQIHAFTRQSNAAMNFDSNHRVRLVGHPTLILTGSQDRVMPPVLTEELAKKIPQAQFKVFPNSAHLLPLEEAEAVNRVIVDFISGRNME